MRNKINMNNYYEKKKKRKNGNRLTDFEDYYIYIFLIIKEIFSLISLLMSNQHEILEKKRK
jgi:hypothetical protein